MRDAPHVSHHDGSTSLVQICAVLPPRPAIQMNFATLRFHASLRRPRKVARPVITED